MSGTPSTDITVAAGSASAAASAAAGRAGATILAVAGVSGEAPPPPDVPPVDPPPPSGTEIILVDQIFDARAYLDETPGPLDIDLIRVTLTPAFAGRIAVPIYLGGPVGSVTGRIGRIEVTTYIGDGVKILPACDGLTIEGGFVHLPAKVGTVHQDGFQVQGGNDVTVSDVLVCGGATLTGDAPQGTHSCVFINAASGPITDVVFDGCRFVNRPGSALNVVSIFSSTRSGCRNCTAWQGNPKRVPFDVGAGAVDPVNDGNLVMAATDPTPC